MIRALHFSSLAFLVILSFFVSIAKLKEAILSGLLFAGIVVEALAILDNIKPNGTHYFSCNSSGGKAGWGYMVFDGSVYVRFYETVPAGYVVFLGLSFESL